MELDDATRLADGLPSPHLTAPRGRELYEHILRERPRDVLELGTCRGGSTLYMAAALDVNGEGSITSLESSRASWSEPTAVELLSRAGLDCYAQLLRPSSTYNWYLRELVYKQRAQMTLGSFDMIFVDGAKDFSTVALSFVLSAELLRPGGWLVCDDLAWAYSDYCPGGWYYGVDLGTLTEEERRIPHVGEAFRLFIAESGLFDEVFATGGWMGWAKRANQAS